MRARIYNIDWRTVLACVFGVCLWLLTFQYSAAQTDDPQRFSAPEITQARIDRLTQSALNNKDIEPEQKKVIGAIYESAAEALRAAKLQQDTIARSEREFENTPLLIEDLKEQIRKAQSAPIEDSKSADMTGEAFLELERKLIARKNEMQAYQTEAERYDAAVQSETQQDLRDTLREFQQALSNTSDKIAEYGEQSLSPIDTAQKALAQARHFLLSNTVLVQELEIERDPSRQQIQALRRDLAQINADRAEQEVIALQNRTGLRRGGTAQSRFRDTELTMTSLEKSHPLVRDYAIENLRIATSLRNIATGAGIYPRLQANSRSQLGDITNDLSIATELTKLGEINRLSAETLRRLRDQRPSLGSLRSNMANNKDRRLTATQQRLWADRRLRGMPIGQFVAKEAIGDWFAENPGHKELGNTDLSELSALYVERRELLQDMSEEAVYEINESKNLAAIQQELLDTTTELSAILDQNLLWLPSVKAIDGKWPLRVWRGTFDVFSTSNFSRSGEVITTQLSRFWFPAIIIAGCLLALVSFRRRMREHIAHTSNLVGRVQKDSYWHTPSVILSTALIAAPLPILIFVVGAMFKGSGAVDNFIEALGQSGVELSGFLWFFLMWREWNKDKSLFGAHYKTPAILREKATRNLNWFIPVAGTSIALVTLTQNSREPDVYEGFSLLAFIATALILAWFSYNILWLKKDRIAKIFSEQHYFRRYHRLLLVFAILLPIAAAILAAIGYYDTARELLSRLFFTGGLIVATYVVYGLMRRSLLVAQRRLSLKQAVERRAQAVKLRQEQMEAEERGEPAPTPPVDYEEIDVEALNRQSVQLINTFTVLGFAVLMWVFWRDLFPALSIFDEVGLWPTEWTTDESGKTIVTQEVSLWNLIQSLAIAGLTFISAKNLPSLLEVFVLNRSKLDRGTRYAIVSILGYIIIAVGFIWAFNKLGMDWSQLQWVFAALGVGIGFGLQEIIANFISGLIILFERPVRVGDYITIGDKSGTVKRIQIRATTLSDLDNREIFIPNKELITQKVTNWTLSDSITRIIIPVGIAYGSDTDKARDIMQTVIKANNRVLDKPKSNVFFLGFGESSLDFELRIFVRSVDDRFGVSHDIHTDINKALKKAGFEIPFPQRDLNLKPVPS